jgi:alkylation response protein AidB-like acyl-CoA dehydrogenase
VIAAAALGAAQAVLSSGVRFTIERQQYGGPVANKQAIQNMVAETRVEVEALRSMIHQAARLAEAGEDFDEYALMTKLFAGRVAKDAANRMLQAHGGYGNMEDYPVARVYRDVRALRIIGGTDEVQKTLIASDLYRQQDFELAL